MVLWNKAEASGGRAPVEVGPIDGGTTAAIVDGTTTADGEKWVKLLYVPERITGWTPRENLSIRVNPFDSRYFHWLFGVLRGDFGQSNVERRSALIIILERLPAERRADFGPPARLRRALGRAAAFLRVAVGPEGRPRWDRFETSSARHNLWTYAVTANVLQRLGGRRNLEAAGRLLKAMLRMRTPSGLLPMQDRGEPVTECAFMQADLFLFLDPFRGRPAG